MEFSVQQMEMLRVFVVSAVLLLTYVSSVSLYKGASGIYRRWKYADWKEELKRSGSATDFDLGSGTQYSS